MGDREVDQDQGNYKTIKATKTSTTKQIGTTFLTTTETGIWKCKNDYFISGGNL